MVEINPRELKLFVVKEASRGALTFPSSSHSIMAAGWPSMDQKINYSDSPEIRSSNNLGERTKDKTGAGSLSLSVLIRPQGILNNQVQEPMGAALFEALQGKRLSFSTLIGTGGVTASVTTIPFGPVTGDKPAPRGVLLLDDGVNTELVLYTKVTFTKDGNGNILSGDFLNCTRGYGNTTAQSFLASSAVTLNSPCYAQAFGRPSLSVWYELDGVTFFARGGSVSEMGLTLSNKGYPQLDLTGGFMEQGQAGKASLAVVATASTSIQLKTGEAKHYTVGARVQNFTTLDTNSGAGYEVVAVDHDLDQLTLNTAVTWAVNDAIQGYLPPYLEIGVPLKSEDTYAELDTFQTVPTGGSVKISSPVHYLEDEISPGPPSDFTEDQRAISASLDSLFESKDLALITNAQNGVTHQFALRLGDGAAGASFWVDFPRCHAQVPPTKVNSTMVTKTLELTALDPTGELDRSALISFI